MSIRIETRKETNRDSSEKTKLYDDRFGTLNITQVIFTSRLKYIGVCIPMNMLQTKLHTKWYTDFQPARDDFKGIRSYQSFDFVNITANR